MATKNDPFWTDFRNKWVDPEDPTVIAETELLGAAASIEAAAKKLEQLKPRAKPVSVTCGCLSDVFRGILQWMAVSGAQVELAEAHVLPVRELVTTCKPVLPA